MVHCLVDVRILVSYMLLVGPGLWQPSLRISSEHLWPGCRWITHLFLVMQTFIVIFQYWCAHFLAGCIVWICVDYVTCENLLPEREAAGLTWCCQTGKLVYDSAIANLPPLRPYPDDISLVCFSLGLSRYRGSWQVSRVSLVGLAWSRHAIGCRSWLKAYLQIAPKVPLRLRLQLTGWQGRHTSNSWW